MEIQEEVAAFNPTGRSSQAMLGWVYSLESKKESRGKSKEESQEEEGYEGKREEKENIRVFSTTSE